MNTHNTPARQSAKQALNDFKDGAQALTAIGRLEIKHFEHRAAHRLAAFGQRLGAVAGMALAGIFSAAFLSLAALHWLILHVAEWQAHLILGAVWATGALLVWGCTRQPAVATRAEVETPAGTVTQIAVEEDRLKEDLASIKREAATWFGLRPQAARWVPLGVAAGLSAAVLHFSRSRRPRRLS